MQQLTVITAGKPHPIIEKLTMKTFEDISGECRDINNQIANLLVEYQNLHGNADEQLRVKEAISLLQQQLVVVQEQIRDNYM